MTPDASPTAPHDRLNLLELLQDGRHFSELRGDQMHIVDSITGNSVVVYRHDKHKSPSGLVRQTAVDGSTIWVEQDILPSLAQKHMPYSPVIVDLICQRIAEGASLTKLCKEVDIFPSYALLRRWARHYPYVDEALNQARKDRAEYLRDQALAEALGVDDDKDPIRGAGLKVEALKWAAGVDDQARYSPKAKIDATVSVPTQIIVQTGIDRGES